MQIVIDIPEETYKSTLVYKGLTTDGTVSAEFVRYIANGTPLPEKFDKIRAEIAEWYWQADKQALAKDPCVVDAMVDLFIRTIDKYKAESEE